MMNDLGNHACLHLPSLKKSNAFVYMLCSLAFKSVGIPGCMYIMCIMCRLTFFKQIAGPQGGHGSESHGSA